MNQKHAEKIINIFLKADNGCEYCASDLLERFIAEFQEHKRLAFALFENTFDKKHKLDSSEDEEITAERTEQYEDKDLKKPYLHGWDDEKIYYWDKTVSCVNDEPELFAKIYGICKRYFESQQKISQNQE